MAEVNSTEEVWSKWNPMAKHYYDTRYNKYESGPGAIMANGDRLALLKRGEITLEQAKLQREWKQSKYPFLIIRKNNKNINETMIKNLFGKDLIVDVEFKLSSRIYFVYFHNIASIESALSILHRFPVNLEYDVGKPRQISSALPTEQDIKDQTLSTNSNCANESVDVISRTIRISEKLKHPEFFKAPLLSKADYAAKDSILKKNDPNRRYLNVKFDFILERHGTYICREKSKIDKCVNIYRHGRLLTLLENIDKPLANVSDRMINHLRECVNCKLYTDASCKYCSMPFCNVFCFGKLAKKHEMNCNSDSSWWKEFYANCSIQSEFVHWQLPDNGSTVKITAFEQTNVLYIRSANLRDEQRYFDVISKVVIKGDKMPRLQQVPCAGTIVLYKFENQIVRAMVLNAENPLSIYVVCVDFGNIEIAVMQELYACCEELAALPRFAIPVILRGVPRRCMYPHVRHLLYVATNSLETFQLKYCEHEFDFSRSMQRVVLIETEKNYSLNRSLKTMLIPPGPNISRTKYTEDYLITANVRTGKHIEMVVMDNSFCQYGFIHCTILDYACEITQMQSDLQLYGEGERKFTSFAPPKNELCVAKYNGKWCRGICVELVGDGHPSILFIDYGNIAPVHVNDIVPYAAELTFPKLTTEFEVLDLPAKPSAKLVERVQELLPVGAILTFDEVIYNEKENNYSLRYDKISLLVKESTLLD